MSRECWESGGRDKGVAFDSPGRGQLKLGAPEAEAGEKLLPGLFLLCFTWTPGLSPQGRGESFSPRSGGDIQLPVSRELSPFPRKAMSSTFARELDFPAAAVRHEG